MWNAYLISCTSIVLIFYTFILWIANRWECAKPTKRRQDEICIETLDTEKRRAANSVWYAVKIVRIEDNHKHKSLHSFIHKYVVGIARIYVFMWCKFIIHTLRIRMYVVPASDQINTSEIVKVPTCVCFRNLYCIWVDVLFDVVKNPYK